DLALLQALELELLGRFLGPLLVGRVDDLSAGRRGDVQRSENAGGELDRMFRALAAQPGERTRSRVEVSKNARAHGGMIPRSTFGWCDWRASIGDGRRAFLSVPGEKATAPAEKRSDRWRLRTRRPGSDVASGNGWADRRISV